MRRVQVNKRAKLGKSELRFTQGTCGIGDLALCPAYLAFQIYGSAKIFRSCLRYGMFPRSGFSPPPTSAPNKMKDNIRLWKTTPVKSKIDSVGWRSLQWLFSLVTTCRSTSFQSFTLRKWLHQRPDRRLDLQLLTCLSGGTQVATPLWLW